MAVLERGTPVLIATIYLIENTASSRKRSCYVGSSIRRDGARKRQHLALLRKGKHHSSRLQDAFSKYGEIAFRFSVLEHCPAEQRFARETYWIQTILPRYNMALVAGTVTGLRWSLTPETKAKMSIAAHNRSEEHKRKLKEARNRQVLRAPRKLNRMNMPGWHQTEETKATIAEAMRQRGPRSQETRKKISESHLGIPKSTEHRRQLSEAAKRRVVTEERLQLLRTVNIGREYSAETKEKRSRSMRAAYARDPTLRHRTGAAIRVAAQRRREKRAQSG